MDRFEALAALLAQRCGTLEVRNEEPMSRHTTFRIGGPAALMALPRTAGEAKAAVRAARELDIRPFFLGNGSNLLVPDEGYRGFVVKLCGLDQTREVNRRLWAESGISLARLANAALGRGLAGLEFAHGIPGTLGGRRDDERRGLWGRAVPDSHRRDLSGQGGGGAYHPRRRV